MSTEHAPATRRELLHRLLDALEEELVWAVSLRERLHALAEVSHDEHETANVLRAALSDVSQASLDGAGFLVRVGDRARTGIAVRAELDALPIVEATGAPFASSNGHMHACGHDVHMASLAAVVRAAATLESELPAPLVALFQPSEEAYPSGARAIVERAAELAPIGAVVAVHVHPEIAWLSVAADSGAVNASCDNVRIVISGSPGHAAYPHRSNDPIAALSQVIVTLQQVVSRRTDPTHGVAVTISWVRGGGADNAIPERAEAGGTLRVLDGGDRAGLRELLREVVEHAAAACGCRGEVSFEEGEPRVINDAALAASIRPALERAGFELAPGLRSCGSDDFGYYGAVAPTLLGFVGLKGAPGDRDVPLHHPRFLPPPEAVAAVARAQIAAYVGAASSLGDPA